MSDSKKIKIALMYLKETLDSVSDEIKKENENRIAFLKEIIEAIKMSPPETLSEKDSFFVSSSAILECISFLNNVVYSKERDERNVFIKRLMNEMEYNDIVDRFCKKNESIINSDVVSEKDLSDAVAEFFLEEGGKNSILLDVMTVNEFIKLIGVNERFGAKIDKKE